MRTSFWRRCCHCDASSSRSARSCLLGLLTVFRGVHLRRPHLSHRDAHEQVRTRPSATGQTRWEPNLSTLRLSRMFRASRVTVPGRSRTSLRCKVKQ